MIKEVIVILQEDETARIIKVKTKEYDDYLLSLKKANAKNKARFMESQFNEDKSIEGVPDLLIAIETFLAKDIGASDDKKDK